MPGCMLILIDHMDGDAVAVCRLLGSKKLSFYHKANCLQDQDIAPKQYAIIAKDKIVQVTIFLFTAKTLSSGVQLARIGLLWKNNPSIFVVPVVLGVTFDFPDAD